MDNTYETPNDGAPRQPWLEGLGEAVGFVIPREPSPDPSTHHHPLADAYRQEPEAHLYGSQPFQEQPNYGRYALAGAGISANNVPQQPRPQYMGPGPAPPLNHPSPYLQNLDPALRAQPYRPTDPHSYPRYSGPGQFGPAYQYVGQQQRHPLPAAPGAFAAAHQQRHPLPAAPGAFAAAYQQPHPQQNYPQPAAPGQFSPVLLSVNAVEPEPRFVRAAQVGPGQYMPEGQAFDVRLPPIQDQRAENPFKRASSGGDADDDGDSNEEGDDDEDRDPRNPGFLKSNIRPHKKICSDFVSDSDNFCMRTSESPSLVAKERADQEIYDRVEELDDKVYDLEDKLYKKEEELEALNEAHVQEVARLKRRAVRVVGDAAVEICGVKRGGPLWDDLVREVQEKMDEPAVDEDEDEDGDGDGDGDDDS
ncbi:hypothetical protein SLS53_001670 [Cytospora paraplurivora]|uniref:Uncharacterized protein n=1 Tax=Cytospora paraplurivora TaxID=2898453 RepID=A0AAN9UJ09_9PEZI